ncbi:MAG: archease [Candidatus Binataceae bacterium]|jgi:SHS2 domain-containing protein
MATSTSQDFFVEFEHTGDVGVEIVAPSRPELFARAVVALGRLMVAGEEIRAVESRTISAAADNDCDLMHDLLAAALNLFLIDGFIWLEAAVDDRGGELTARLTGERFDPARHEFRGEIKAVTYHQLEVAPAPNGDWRARIIFDR